MRYCHREPVRLTGVAIPKSIRNVRGIATSGVALLAMTWNDKARRKSKWQKWKRN